MISSVASSAAFLRNGVSFGLKLQEKLNSRGFCYSVTLFWACLRSSNNYTVLRLKNFSGRLKMFLLFLI